MLTRLKQKVQQLLEAEARAAHNLRLTPNMISVFGLVLALLAALAYSRWEDGSFYLPVAIIMLLASGFCDVLDGALARLHQQTTAFGGFLDSVLDRYADAAIYTGIIIGGLCDQPILGLVALVGSLLVSYSRARAEAANVKMESVGIAERAERMIVLIAASLTAIYWQPTTVIDTAMILLAILSNLTVAQRGFYAYGKLKKKNLNEN
jgi:archaetidylinositol phosphate synthase